MDALGQRLRAGRLDRRQPIGQHGGQNLDHLPVAIVGAGELATDAIQRRRQHPVLERRAIAQRAGLSRQHRHIMPGIVSDPAAPEPARMLGDDPTILADDDAIRIGLDLDRTADRARVDRVAVVVEADETGLGHRRRQRMESVEAPAIGDQLRPLLLERLPDRLPRLLGMGVRLGPAQAFVDQPGVEVVIGLEPQAAA